MFLTTSLRVRYSETSGDKNRSHIKKNMQNGFIAYFRPLYTSSTLFMLNTLHKVEDHETMRGGFISQMSSTWEGGGGVISM